MATERTPQLRSLGNGTYRVTGIRVNPTNGRYILNSTRSGEQPAHVVRHAEKPQAN